MGSKKHAELSEVCNEAVAVLSQIMQQVTAAGESLVFYLKMTGDYYRYLGEFADEGKMHEVASRANDAYTKGMQMAEALDAANSVRLGLALNFSVFQHEVLRNTQVAQ